MSTSILAQPTSRAGAQTGTSVCVDGVRVFVSLCVCMWLRSPAAERVHTTHAFVFLGVPCSSTAEVSTIQLEFKYLSQVTGDHSFFDRVTKVHERVCVRVRVRVHVRKHTHQP